MKTNLILLFLFFCSSVQLVAQCPGNLITNGSFDSMEGEAVTAPGWSANSTPDINDPFGPLNTTPGYNWTGTPEASEDGGTWQNMYGAESVSQTLSLVAGETYTVSFEYASMGIEATGLLFDDPTQVQVSIANNVIYTSPLDNTLFTWEKVCFSFVAPNNVVTLRFQPLPMTYVGIDGICLLQGDFISQGLEVDLGNDTTLCTGQTLTLDVGIPGGSYVWQDDSTEPTFTITEAGTYYVTVGSSCTSGVDTIVVDYNESIPFDLGEDTFLCEGENLILDASTPNSTYLWQDGSTGPTFTVAMPGTYWVEVSDPFCTFSDTIEVFELNQPMVDLGEEELFLCDEATYILDATQNNVEYLWQDGTMLPTLEVNQSGTYAVTVSNACGEASDDIDITFAATPIVDFGADTILCEGTSLSLNATQGDASYLWQDGSMDTTYEISQSGLYAVTITNACGQATDEIEVEVVLNPTVDLGGDQIFCDQDSFLLPANAMNGSIMWSDGSDKATLVVRESGMYSITVSNECGEVSDMVMLTSGTSPQVDLGPDQIICEGNSLILDAGSAADSYIWQDGSDLQTLEVFRGGSYQVIVQNDCGTDTDEIEITLDDCKCDIYIPNAFSPNDDGFNDRLNIFRNCVFQKYQMQIFDRWGNLIFESDNPDHEWDGSINGADAAIGVYVYWLTFTNELGIDDQRSGSVHLLR